jgi:D-threo-aldose 1-dehydrogenase
MITDATPVRVGDTDLFAPRVGLGTAVLGNFLQAISDADAVAVIRRALASGVRYIDTAPLYGHGLAELVRTCDLDVVLLAGRYTLLDQTALADLLPLCESRGVSVVIGGVFNSGILIDPVPGAHFNYLPADQALLAKARAIREICDKHDVPLAAAAIQFPLAHPRVCTVLMGPRTTGELETDLSLFEVEIPPRLWADLRHEGLLGGDVPTPE